MNVNTKDINPALASLFKDCEQVVFLDANLFIVPDRSKIGARPIAFQKYQELVEGAVKAFADEKKEEVPTKLRVFKDSELTGCEKNSF